VRRVIASARGTVALAYVICPATLVSTLLYYLLFQLVVQLLLLNYLEATIEILFK
jgi:hypothetical protein